MKKIFTLCLAFFTLTAFGSDKTQDVQKPLKANIINLLSEAKQNILSKNRSANVYTAFAGVDASPDDAQYFDFLTSAYNQAVLELKANIVLRKSGDVAIQEAFNFHRKKVPDDMLKQSLKNEVDMKLAKLEAEQNMAGIFGLVNVIVGKALQKEEPKKAQTLKADAMENIFNKSYTEGFIKQGFDEIEGLIPTDTFIVTNEKGEVEVGVVAYSTKRSIQLARDLKNGHYSKKTSNELNCKSAKEVANALQDEQELLSHFGLKYFYNENCRPSLLAYGMDSFTKEEGMNTDYRNESMERARGIADKFISNFLNSNIDAFIKDKKLSQKTKDAIMDAMKKGERTTYKTQKKKRVSMIKEMSKEFTNSSQMDLRGLEDARVWNIDKDDYEVVGVMRYYSRDSIEAANKEFNPNLKEKKVKKSIKSKVQHSSNLDVNDF